MLRKYLAAVILTLTWLATAKQESPPNSVPIVDSNVNAKPVNVAVTR